MGFTHANLCRAHGMFCLSRAGVRALTDELTFCRTRHVTAVQVPLQAPPHGGAGEIMQRFMAIWNRDVREAALLLAAHDVRPHDPTPAMKLGQLQDENWVRPPCRAALTPRTPVCQPQAPGLKALNSCSIVLSSQCMARASS